MARGTSFDTSPNLNAVLLELFGPMLNQQGLATSDIASYSLDELADALDRVNSAIAVPEQFGTAVLARDPSGKLTAVLAGANERGQFGILPLLLERKRLVLARIKELRGKEQVDNLQDLVDRVTDDDVKAALREQLAELQRAASALDAQAKETELAARGARDAARRSLKLQDIEVMERRWEVWQKFLARESIATLIGAILAIVMGISLVVSMFAHVPASEIVSNGFLVILGYFFGQASERRGASAAPEQAAVVPPVFNLGTRDTISPVSDDSDDVW